MWFYVIVWSGLLTLEISAVPGSLDLLVDLFNELIGLTVSFDHDFGNGVPLLQGKARVYIYHSIELLPHSLVDRQAGLSILELRSAQGFRITPKISTDPRGRGDLNLEKCYVRVQYSVNRNATEPASVWVHSCQVRLVSATPPPNPEQVLPLLSQALYLAARRYLSFSGTPEGLPMTEVQRVLDFLMYHSIVS